MKPILVPKTDVNSESFKIVRWYVSNKNQIQKGDPIAELETSKSVFDLPAPESGWILLPYAVGEEISLSDPLAYLFATEAELHEFDTNKKQSEATSKKEDSGKFHASQKAETLANKHNVDLSKINKKGLITQKDVEILIASQTRKKISNLPKPLKSKKGFQQCIRPGLQDRPHCLYQPPAGRTIP